MSDGCLPQSQWQVTADPNCPGMGGDAFLNAFLTEEPSAQTTQIIQIAPLAAPTQPLYGYTADYLPGEIAAGLVPLAAPAASTGADVLGGLLQQSLGTGIDTAPSLFESLLGRSFIPGAVSDLTDLLSRQFVPGAAAAAAELGGLSAATLEALGSLPLLLLTPTATAPAALDESQLNLLAPPAPPEEPPGGLDQLGYTPDLPPRLPEPGQPGSVENPLTGPSIEAPRPTGTPAPVVPPFGVPGGFQGGGLAPRPRPATQPNTAGRVITAPAPASQRVVAPSPATSVGPAPAPSVQPSPSPLLPRSPPTRSKPALAAIPGVDPQVHPNTLPLGQVSKDECPKKTKQKKRKQRTVCHRGTYVEHRVGLSKSPKEKIPCR